MDNKKVGVAVAVVAAVAAAYGGATWYLGQRAQAGYQDAVAELRKALGDDAVVSADYDKGFFSSKARLVMQWAGAPAQEGRPASPPLRLVVDTVVRHGPLAGARVAAAVADYRFALEGLDDEALAHLDKASAPVLTSVHHLTGSHDVHLRLPAGEAEGGDGVALRWQEMVSDFAIGRGGRRLQGKFRWPEFNITGLPDSAAQAAAEYEEENDADETASAEPVDRTSITVGGMEGTFDYVPINGLWGIGPGKGDMRFARVAASVQPAEGRDPRPLLDVRNATGIYLIDATDSTLSMTTTMSAAGRIGALDFDSLGLEEKIQRIDIEAIRSFQRTLLDGYRAGGLAQAMASMEERGAAVLTENAPRLVAALPAYSMKMKATYQGRTGQLEYGGEVKRAPSDAEVAQAGWMSALMKTSVLQATARVPKAWALPLMQSTGRPGAQAQDVDAMVAMAQSSGYLLQEGEFLTSSIQLQPGQLTLNGKTLPLPSGAAR
ncbi:DUF945 domain-containing protein [Paracidovorax avenae]|uniref:YdgA family protein n=1 Tax=Paracidovorax avenae TaxID=80867 RepID=UPI000D16FD3C|nr:DUF945 family protein [Paracidovorax avenae]AVS91080.1 DUF945 domain-containing protein [Paracidovorax avenae]AVS98881.1 DUF945 domain-containing protein [Paracidovorax avenae]AVT05980.1 DUF945 domain-containing protein [Paracidovorax avenae]AVT20311.1 DUF945 domain-containing protein [Paracidovorax avenae]